MAESTKRTPGRGWAYTGAILGGAVSVAANVAHSYVPPEGAAVDWSPNVGAVVGAVFWPVALFVAIEILARVAWPAGGRWVALRFGGLLPVAVVAAVVSYRHLSGLLAYYSEDGLTVAIGPLAVDGLMVMSAGALIAMGRRPATEPVTEAVTPATSPVDVTAAVADMPKAIETVTPADTTPAPKRTPARTLARTSAATKADTDTAKKVAKLAVRLADIPKDKLAATIATKLDISARTVRRHLAALDADTPPDVPADITPDSAADTKPVNGTPVPELITTSGSQS